MRNNTIQYVVEIKKDKGTIISTSTKRNLSVRVEIRTADYYQCILSCVVRTRLLTWHGLLDTRWRFQFFLYQVFNVIHAIANKIIISTLLNAIRTISIGNTNKTWLVITILLWKCYVMSHYIMCIGNWLFIEFFPKYRRIILYFYSIRKDHKYLERSNVILPIIITSAWWRFTMLLKKDARRNVSRYAYYR